MLQMTNVVDILFSIGCMHAEFLDNQITQK